MPDISFASAFPGWLEALLAVYLVVGSVLGIGFIVGVIILVVKVKRFVAHVSKQVDSVATKVTTTADHVTTTVNTLADRAQRIGETVETMVRRVAHKVDVTTDVLRDAIAGPVINVSSVATGIRRAIETWLERRRGHRRLEEDRPE